MNIQINADGSVVCTMTPLQFIGVFRTYGGTSSSERETRPNIRLTEAEDFAATLAYGVAYNNEVFHEMLDDDRE